MIKIEELKKYPENWDKIIDASLNGTLFHKKKFLNYHNKKFTENFKILKFYKNNKLICLLDFIEIYEREKKTLKSPYGGSYGSFIFLINPTYSQSSSIIHKFIEYLKHNKFDEAYLVPTPDYLFDHSFNTFEFNLKENNFKTIYSDISSVCKIKSFSDYNEKFYARKMKYDLKKLAQKKFTINQNNKIEDLYYILKKNFEKHGSNPTHTFEELKYLVSNLSSDIDFFILYYDGVPISSIFTFHITKSSSSLFYISQDPNYQSQRSITFLIDHVLKYLFKKDCLIVDFGTSSVKNIPRPSLFDFKEKFNALGYFRKTFYWENTIDN